MILKDPFKISARLLPAIRFNDAWLSFDPQKVEFYIDFADGTEYVVDDFGPGAGSDIQSCFAAILGFMNAAAESRGFRERTGRPGENEDLFPPHVVDWIMRNKDDIEAYGFDLEEGPPCIL